VIVDAHTHVIAPDEQAYPFSPRDLSGAWYREAPHSAEGLLALMDACGVGQAVVVQAVGAYSYDNRYAAHAVAKHAGRFVGACCIDATADAAPDELSRWIEGAGMHGVRIFALAREGTSWLDDPRTFPVWERARRLGAHVIVTIFLEQLPQLRTLLERFGEIEVSLDHCAFPPLDKDPASELAPLLALAEHPNLNLKVSTEVLDAAARAGDPRRVVELLVGRFGARRVMWGSDFCQTHDREYAVLFDLAQSAFSGLTNEERALCLGGTAQRLWPALDATRQARPA